mmetsp:Transcript_22299/g.37557  ORF Transcript_22299/g.37557 Transcript_22299/m.37557 type:complete len:333 (-) Transcript_22299:38-1036(-)
MVWSLRVIVLVLFCLGHPVYCLLVPGTTDKVAQTTKGLLSERNRLLVKQLGIITASSAAGLHSFEARIPARAADKLPSMLDNSAFDKSIFNVPPSVTEYPVEMEGTWRTTFTFKGAEFTDSIPFQELSSDVNIPGFRKYSVIYAPDIGSDCVADLKFERRQNYSPIVENREYNIASLVSAFTAKDAATVDSVDIDQSGNRCSLTYHDVKGSGKVELFTNSRTWKKRQDGIFECQEQIRQYNVRQSNSGRRGTSQVLGDYGLRWVFQPLTAANMDSSSSSSKDARSIQPTGYSGQLMIFSYLQPQDPLYFQRPLKPVGVFVYGLDLKNIDNSN